MPRSAWPGYSHLPCENFDREKLGIVCGAFGMPLCAAAALTLPPYSKQRADCRIDCRISLCFYGVVMEAQRCRCCYRCPVAVQHIPFLSLKQDLLGFGLMT